MSELKIKISIEITENEKEKHRVSSRGFESHPPHLSLIKLCYLVLEGFISTINRRLLDAYFLNIVLGSFVFLCGFLLNSLSEIRFTTFLIRSGSYPFFMSFSGVYLRSMR